MTTLLLRPDNNQPAAFVAYRDGMIALDTTCVSPATRWFTMQAVQVCNPAAKVLAAFDAGMVYDQPMPLLTVILTPELARNVNHAAGVRILSLEHNISLYHESMDAA